MSFPTMNLDLHHEGLGCDEYELLRDHFVRQIENGRVEPAEMLPMEQTLDDALGVLEREGLSRRIQGKGTFVHEDAPCRLEKGSELFALLVPETRSGFYPSLL